MKIGCGRDDREQIELIIKPMTRKRDLAPGIEQIYKTSLRKRFPYQDCYQLQRKFPTLRGHFIPDLDTYLSFVAGYASSATSLKNRSREELKPAIPRLRQSFFESYPRYLPFADEIDEESAPDLFEQLRCTDRARRSLVKIIEALLSRRPSSTSQSP